LLEAKDLREAKVLLEAKDQLEAKGLLEVEVDLAVVGGGSRCRFRRWSVIVS
jgi:hypothetical protein